MIQQRFTRIYALLILILLMFSSVRGVGAALNQESVDIPLADTSHQALSNGSTPMSDGTLDTTFGSGGIVTTDFTVTTPGSRGDVASKVHVQNDGKIVVVDEANTGSVGHMARWSSQAAAVAALPLLATTRTVA
jgi:hypothetical protein